MPDPTAPVVSQKSVAACGSTCTCGTCGTAPAATAPPASTAPTGIPDKAVKVVRYAASNNGARQQGYVGGRRFANDGRGGGERLPTRDKDGKAIAYKEYDVNPHTPPQNRGAERVVIGDDGKAYYTNDHYRTFKKMN